ncbi:hypothetical protein EA187_05745 [Lujinxingia sediminis]|uniref:SEC-C motif-containing protein n=1 Tax=Lujinxingia sediminis TaxID=2480984 RepID=A0ABY0CZ30_9DELT|nr:SEC-C metal-binding domain-containing protein [Lujinxingia sediminis]RVU48928.1 hypothetical protein EA187_05745 [Lujinxingia sediminis]
MSEATPASEIPESIGRNDPCPCGSGQKYKRCCQRTHQIQKESEKQSREPHQLIGSKTIPYKVYKVLTQVHESNALAFYYDLSHEAGPFRERYPEKSAFIEAVDKGEDAPVAGPDYDLQHFRIDGPDVLMVLTRGQNDPRVEEVEVDVVTLRPNQLGADGQEREVAYRGFRIWDVQHHTLKKDDFNATSFPDLSKLGVSWKKVD